LESEWAAARRQDLDSLRQRLLAVDSDLAELARAGGLERYDVAAEPAGLAAHRSDLLRSLCQFNGQRMTNTTGWIPTAVCHSNVIS
jgi:hypothetical protein